MNLLLSGWSMYVMFTPTSTPVLIHDNILPGEDYRAFAKQVAKEITVDGSVPVTSWAPLVWCVPRYQIKRDR